MSNQQNSYDELNIVGGSSEQEPVRDILPIDDFFGEMELDDYEIAKRISLAKSIYAAITFIFSMIRASKVANEEIDWNHYNNYLFQRMDDIYSSVYGKGKYTSRAMQSAFDIINTTQDKVEGGSTSDYWLSNDRATLDAENEVNFVANEDLFNQAVENGYRYKNMAYKG